MVYNESEILDRLALKDELCVKMMFDNYYRALCVYALKYLVCIEDAEDVVQSVFVTFWENKKGRPFEGSIRSYLFGAVAKSSLKHLERSGRFLFDDIEEHVNQFLEEMNLYEDEELQRLREKINREIEKLPQKSKEVFKAIVLENQPYKEVAVQLNISVNTVKTHYAHALKQLRDNLDYVVLLVLFMD